MSRRRGVLAAGVVVAVAVVALTAAWLTADRPFAASVPQPPPLDAVTTYEVRGGQTICIGEITILPTSEVARFRVGTSGAAAVPFDITVDGAGGYRSTARVAADWQDNDLIEVPITPPDRAMHGRFCARNAGRGTVEFYTAFDRTLTAAQTSVDGKRIPPNLVLAFAEAEPTSIGARLGTIVDQVTAFRPGIVAGWLVVPLALLVLLGIPGLMVLSLVRALGEDDA